MPDPDPDRTIHGLLNALHINLDGFLNGSPWPYVALLAALILFRAFFVVCETAIISLNDNKLRKMAQDGNRRAKTIVSLIDRPSHFLAGTQAGMALSGFVVAAVSANIFALRLAVFVQERLPLAPRTIWGLCTLLVSLFFVYLTLLFGELVPKHIATHHYEKIAFAFAPLFSAVLGLLSPFIYILSASGGLVLRLIGIDPAQQREEITEEEIRMMIDVGNESGTIEQAEKEMINNVFEFDDRTAGDIMTHRTEIVALGIDANLRQVIELAIKSGYSRFPIFEDDLDSIVGILNIKDLLGLFFEQSKNFDISRYMRRPLYVLESTSCKDMFASFRETKTQVAIVVDEYGGTAGMITVEDLVETIVGNIQDEYDNEQEDIIALDQGTYQVSGVAPMDAVCRYFCLSVSDADEFDTIGGYIINRLGQLPEDGEAAFVRVQDILFTVEQSDERRITRLRAERIAEPAETHPQSHSEGSVPV